MNKVYEVITDRIVALLEQGCVPWRRPWVAGAPRSLTSGKPYRGINALMLSCQPYWSPWWLTFSEAVRRGGYVRRGEKGVPVLFFARRDDEDEDSKRPRMIVRYSTVFNVSQVDGVSAPSTTDFRPLPSCEMVAERYTNGPVVQHRDPRAYYSPSADLVNVPDRRLFKSLEHYYGTLWHELMHSTGAQHRLARPGVTSGAVFGSHEYSFEELVAEIGSAFLAGEAGIGPALIEDSAAYVAGWLERLKDDRRLVVGAAAAAQRGVDVILGRVMVGADKDAKDAHEAA
ncbi:MAG: hypothetical protein V7645_3061 [Actinomycetota bacterium]|jgi:antirestriction protein ArdC